MQIESHPTYYPLAHPVMHFPLGVSPGVSILFFFLYLKLKIRNNLPGHVKHLLVPKPLQVKHDVSQAEQIKVLTPVRE